MDLIGAVDCADLWTRGFVDLWSCGWSCGWICGFVALGICGFLSGGSRDLWILR